MDPRWSFLFRDLNFLGLPLLVKNPPSFHEESAPQPIRLVIWSTISSQRELVLTKRNLAFCRARLEMKWQALRMQIRVLSESIMVTPLRAP